MRDNQSEEKKQLQELLHLGTFMDMDKQQENKLLWMLRSWSDFISFQTGELNSVRARNSCMLEGKENLPWVEGEMICCFTHSAFSPTFCFLSLTSSVLILYFLLFLSTHNILMSGGDQLWLISCVYFAVMLNSLIVPPSIACLRPFTERAFFP